MIAKADGPGAIYALPDHTRDPAVFQFTPEGKFVNKFGSPGDKPDQFGSPQTIAVDNQSRVYVADYKKIIVFDKNGRYLDTLGLDSNYRVFSMAFNDKNELLFATGTQIIKLTLNWC